jgi:hypothetical protein
LRNVNNGHLGRVLVEIAFVASADDVSTNINNKNNSKESDKNGDDDDESNYSNIQCSSSDQLLVNDNVRQISQLTSPTVEMMSSLSSHSSLVIPTTTISPVVNSDIPDEVRSLVLVADSSPGKPKRGSTTSIAPSSSPARLSQAFAKTIQPLTPHPVLVGEENEVVLLGEREVHQLVDITVHNDVVVDKQSTSSSHSQFTALSSISAPSIAPVEYVSNPSTSVVSPSSTISCSVQTVQPLPLPLPLPSLVVSSPGGSVTSTPEKSTPATVCFTTYPILEEFSSGPKVESQDLFATMLSPRDNEDLIESHHSVDLATTSMNNNKRRITTSLSHKVTLVSPSLAMGREKLAREKEERDKEKEKEKEKEINVSETQQTQDIANFATTSLAIDKLQITSTNSTADSKTNHATYAAKSGERGPQNESIWAAIENNWESAYHSMSLLFSGQEAPPSPSRCDNSDSSTQVYSHCESMTAGMIGLLHFHLTGIQLGW